MLGLVLQAIVLSEIGVSSSLKSQMVLQMTVLANLPLGTLIFAVKPAWLFYI